MKQDSYKAATIIKTPPYKMLSPGREDVRDLCSAALRVKRRGVQDVISGGVVTAASCFAY